MNHTIILTKPIRIAWKKSLKEISAENNIFVKNIPQSANEKDLESLFLNFGQIFSCKISVDDLGKSRGYGYV
jgi:polyadenylate-binding protein